ncbi:hypothetical protein [Fodinibius sediminis]|uniref:Uncharacterized protein n=1 Tax=Fodinibius sediminis TaxID=1214077 RepID=A0A521CGD9_9BACT|nr:hypothetical protein [Fodinibius sediminis]SMO58506.1 hypothetical protein SAMN06265218_10658 [Fodinibius sediminis]
MNPAIIINVTGERGQAAVEPDRPRPEALSELATQGPASGEARAVAAPRELHDIKEKEGSAAQTPPEPASLEALEAVRKGSGTLPAPAADTGASGRGSAQAPEPLDMEELEKAQK